MKLSKKFIIPLVVVMLGTTSVVVIIFVKSNSNSAEKKSSAATTPPMGTSGAALAPIEGIVVKTSSIQEIIEVSGTLTAFEETVLMPEISGRVVAVNLPEGKTVTKGTLLVKLFDGDLQTQRKKLQVQLQIAETTEKRQHELLGINGISQQEYDLSALQVSNLKAEIDIVTVQIGKTEIRAPFDGRIGLKKVSVGAYISPVTPIVTIRTDQKLKLDFSVPEKYSAEMIAGKNVQFKVEGSTTTFDASIMATEQGIQESTRNLNVRAVVHSKSLALVPGGFAQVSVVLGKNDKAIMVPSQSIIPQARDKRVIVSRNGKAEFVKVKTGIRQASLVEVLEGIRAGDTIVTTGVLFIRPDAPLQFSKVH